MATSLRPHPRSVRPSVRPGTIQQRLDSINGLLLSQPFFVAKIFTCTPEKFVNLVTIILISMRYCQVIEASFYSRELATATAKRDLEICLIFSMFLLRKFGFWSYLCCLLRTSWVVRIWQFVRFSVSQLSFCFLILCKQVQNRVATSLHKNVIWFSSDRDMASRWLTCFSEAISRCISLRSNASFDQQDMHAYAEHHDYRVGVSRV